MAPATGYMGKIIMAEFESKEVVLNADQNTVYAFLSDFRNFNKLIPEQIEEWEATADFCSFKAENAGQVRLKYKTRNTDLIEIEPDMNLPVSGEITLFVKLKDQVPNTLATIGMKISIPPMFSMMLNRPLKKLLEIIAESLQKHFNG
jgi:carbon monoxide dehydrogenase subunit G